MSSIHSNGTTHILSHNHLSATRFMQRNGKGLLAAVVLAAMAVTTVRAETFSGINAPGTSTNFPFLVSAGTTNFSLTVANTTSEFSHLLLKLGGTATTADYDFIAQFDDGRTNAINLELPECVATNYEVMVYTPTNSAEHAFVVMLETNVADLRSASLPAAKPQAFIADGSLTNGQWQYFQVEIPTNSPGWRLVLNSSGTGIPELDVRCGDEPTPGQYLKQVSGLTNGTIILTDTEVTEGTWFIGVYLADGTTEYSLFSEVGYITELNWDPGTADLGTEVFTNTSMSGGDYYFGIHPQNTDIGVWRTALNVLMGEADIYMQQDWQPGTGSGWQSTRTGSDGFVVHSSQYTLGQEWDIMVHATPGAQWNLVSGRAYVTDLGELATNDASGSGPVSIGAEGMRYFKTTVPPETMAWRLWLNGMTNTLYVRKSFAPHPVSYDLMQDLQMLVVPDYVSTQTFSCCFVGVAGAPGETINLDSRQQSVTPLDFISTTNVTVSGFGYAIYNIQVPIDQIAWQVSVASSAGDANVAVRRNKVPNEWNNDIFSEVGGSVVDSVTLVPPTLSDGSFYITVYGIGPYTFTLASTNPVVTDIAFVSCTTNDDPDRVGWRYYRVADIPSQLGCLGWDLLLQDHVPGTEIALRRNAVPGHWFYRQDGYTYANNGHVDYSGIEFLQRPGHLADIWYIGVFMPTIALGDFTLITRTLTASPVGFDTMTTNIVNQPVGKFEYFRIEVPTNAVGWDVRLTDVTSGDPHVVVRRDQLPDSLSTYGFYWWDGNNNRQDAAAHTTWPSGSQWAAGGDWTGLWRDPSGSNDESGRILAMGMGNPLEPGTYYVGVINGSGSDAMSYTLVSRGIGDGFALPVVEVPFAGGSATTNDVAPREAAYYRVEIPTNTPSWQMRLRPTSGEALLQVQWQNVPNISPCFGSPYGGGGIRMQKVGLEQWVLLPENGTDIIRSGTYYLAAVSEGENPWYSEARIGSGSSSWTLESFGSMGITNIGTVGSEDLTQADTLEGGAAKAYQFTVPEGTLSMEVRLEDRVGNPCLKLVAGDQLPRIMYYWGDTYGNYGGNNQAMYNASLITVPNPATGVYSVIVNASDSGGVFPDAEYTLRVHALTPTPVAFDNGLADVTNQLPDHWQYFLIEVPTNAVGWDVRVKDVTSGDPHVVVRRDQLPDSLSTHGFWYNVPTMYTNWPSGSQWAADQDWTGLWRDPSGSNDESGRILAMGMCNPLEPGTYYVGVLNGSDFGEGTNTMSYTLESRGIGDGLALPVIEVPFSGGSATTNDVAPREAAYYRVEILTNTPSWQMRLRPTEGEAMLEVQWQNVPNIALLNNWGLTTPYGTGGARMQKVGCEQWVLLPENGTDNIRSGIYYLAVVSEGENPVYSPYSPDNSRIGSGSSSWTVESFGSMGVTNLGTVGTEDLTQADTLEGGAAKACQFTVPEGTLSMEVRLEDRVGNPCLKLAEGDRLPRIYYWSYWCSEAYGNYGGNDQAIRESSLITVPNPATGVYSVIVNASDSGGMYPDATYTLRVRQMPIPDINFSANLNTNGLTNIVSGTLVDNQRAFYRVVVPAINEGHAVVGWRLDVAQSQGAATVRVRQDSLPADSAPGTTPFMASSSLIVPPFLTAGIWYVEVRGSGNTDFTLTSRDFNTERPAWIMPGMGEPVTTPGLTAPEFGDTGTDTNGLPLPGDQGIDLGNGMFHYYAVIVPTNNAVLIRTMLEAISGNPDLYIRASYPPTLSHDANGNGGSIYERASTGTGTEYGNWVPHDGRYESWLTPGYWYFAVQAAGNANCRYRLHITSGTVTNLDLDGGSVSGQIIAGGDWRYYRVDIPTNAPANWNITFSQQQGDVTMYVRDTVPPGNKQAQDWYFDYLDWASDNKNNGPYQSYDTPGTYSVVVPPVRPGHTYYVGFRAVNDASFSFSSATEGGDFGAPIVIPFYGGTSTLEIPAGGMQLFRVDVPADATRWIYSSTHSNDVQVFMEQGTVPYLDYTADWQSGGSADSGFDYYLLYPNNWPWVPNKSYYIVATNMSDVAQSITIANTGIDNLPPTNDMFADRIVLSGATIIVTGNNANATAESGEPAFLNRGKSVWWTWTAPFNGIVTNSTVGSSFDTVLGVYTGSSVDALGIVAEDDNNGGGSASLAVFECVKGTAYQLAVDGPGGASGIILLDLCAWSSSHGVPQIATNALIFPSCGSVLQGELTTDIVWNVELITDDLDDTNVLISKISVLDSNTLEEVAIVTNDIPNTLGMVQWQVPAPLALGETAYVMRFEVVNSIALTNARVFSDQPFTVEVGMPFIDITNDAVTVGNDIATTIIAGTNNTHVVGDMWIIDASYYAQTFAANAEWTAPEVSLIEGENLITVYGTNAWGMETNDTVIITRGPVGTGMPFVDITNDAMTVGNDITTAIISGTNNTHVVGDMWIVDGSYYAQTFAANAEWTAPEVSLIEGENLITVYGTNTWGMETNDTVIITRGPVGTGTPFVNITNEPVTVSFDVTTYAVAGTNNIHVMGDMWVLNTTMGGATQVFTMSQSWTAPAVEIAVGANTIVVCGTNVLGVSTNDSVIIERSEFAESNVELYEIGRGSDYGQVQLSWSNGPITVLACTNRTYVTNEEYWSVLTNNVSPPWTHADATNFASVYYRIVSGGYTSSYDVGKFDVDIAAGSIAWLSFPFDVQPGCDVLSEWFGQQLEPRNYSGANYPVLQRQDGVGGQVDSRNYYIDNYGDYITNWFPTNPVPTIVANAGYILFLPEDHPGVKLTGIGMVQTNNVFIQVPYASVPWAGLAYPVSLDMRASGVTNLFVPPATYSSFNYDYLMAQEPLGGSPWYTEYFIDDWGTGTTNFFPSVAGADNFEAGKGYLVFFSTDRSGTGVWTCVKPY